ncbi:recA bacterial DNA recombination family protein [Mycobacterium xenopi 4042]|uniref:Regulatory protein RecX n=1 Tax=Mycobacterium xenopi 4042 TaxID=1299334 RepID=X8CHP5_MYCXE|nr:recA bacterial DNA recombination family protein [Mycobacterium xenopi 4042]
MDQGLIRKSGAWFTYEGEQLGQGKENARNFLLQNTEVANEIEKKIKEKLGIGAVVTDDDVLPAPSTSDGALAREEQARALCLRLLTARSRTRAELEGQLAKRGYPADVSDRVLDRLAAVGLVDDVGFAQQWVDSRRANAGKGKRALAAELHRKGVGNDVITAVLGGLDAGVERDRAEQLVRPGCGARPWPTTMCGSAAGWWPCWCAGVRPDPGLRRGQHRTGRRTGAPPGVGVAAR